MFATAALAARQPSPEDLLALGVNELVFLAMCASVIWASERMSAVVAASKGE